MSEESSNLPVFGPNPPPQYFNTNSTTTNQSPSNFNNNTSPTNSINNNSNTPTASSTTTNTSSTNKNASLIGDTTVNKRGNTPVPSSANSIRPYRSRRNRPCDFCRRRKTRCDMLPEGICAMCKKINGHCTFVAQPAKKKKIEQKDSPKPLSATKNGGKASNSGNNSNTAVATNNNTNSNNNNNNTNATKIPSPKKTLPPVIDVPPFQQPPLNMEEDREPPLVPEGYDAAALMGISGDQDPYLLQYYNYDQNETYGFIEHAIRRVDNDPAFPVQFLAFKDTQKDAKVKQEIQEQRKRIFEKVNKLEERLLALYFRFAYPTYPIVDRESFYHDYYHNKENISVGVLAGLLALSCIWWKYDSLLCVHVMPKNLANELFEECEIAIKRETRYPTLASVQCLLLLTQRRLQPSDTAETFQLPTMIAKLVSISHNLGLHLDCDNWSIAPSTKRLRKRLWTTVYIMEKWTTITAGRPSMLNWNDCTVNEYTSQEPSAQLFVQMNRLTILLDDIAQDLYSIRHQRDRLYNPDSNHVWEKVNFYFSKLEEWRDQLPEDLRDMQSAPEGEFCKNGTLQLAALTIEAMLHKVRLHAVCVSGVISKEQLREFRVHANETILTALKFTSEITHSHLHAFWYATTRLNFSTVAHFMYFYHITSPTRQEHRDTKEILRKWMFVLRVLSQGWEEGTGLAALKMDTISNMGNQLFTNDTPGLNGEMEREFEMDLMQHYQQQHQQQQSQSQSQSQPQHLHQQPSSLSSFPDNAEHLDHPDHPPYHHHPDNPDQIPSLPDQPPLPLPDEYGPPPPHLHQDPHMRMPDSQDDLQQMTFYHPLNHDYPIYNNNTGETTQHPLLEEENEDDMLLLNEDIMPQEEQTHLLEEDVPENLEDAYAEYFSNDRFHDEGFLTQDLHELFTVHTQSGLTPDPAFV